MPLCTKRWCLWMLAGWFGLNGQEAVGASSFVGSVATWLHVACLCTCTVAVFVAVPLGQPRGCAQHCGLVGQGRMPVYCLVKFADAMHATLCSGARVCRELGSHVLPQHTDHALCAAVQRLCNLSVEGGVQGQVSCMHCCWQCLPWLRLGVGLLCEAVPCVPTWPMRGGAPGQRHRGTTIGDPFSSARRCILPRHLAIKTKYWPVRPGVARLLATFR
jgi:hypothetical protein